MLEGGIRVLLAEALFPLTGVLTVVFLTRRLGPEGYGVLVLSTTVIALLEWAINSFFARLTIKFVSEAPDWRPIGSRLVRLHFMASVVGMLLIWLLSVPLTASLSEPPTFARYLCLFALDMPLFSLAQSHRHILVGTGDFGKGAVASASRWIVRLAAIVILVELGLSIYGAILGSLAASLVELAVVRWYVRPRLSAGSDNTNLPLWNYALPLLLSSVSILAFNRLDLFALKMLGGSTAEAGIYGAAQNLSLLPTLFASCLSPLLLSSLSRLLAQRNEQLARNMGGHAIRLTMILLPVAAVIAGAAPEIIGLFFGQVFLPAAPLLGMLTLASTMLVVMSVAGTILTAADKPGWTLTLTVPLIPLAILGHIIMVPRFGAIGAASVTAVLASLGAAGSLTAVYRLWHIVPPAGTLGRSLFVSAVAYLLAVGWLASGFIVIVKLVLIGLLIAAGYLVLREFTDGEIALARTVGWKIFPLEYLSR
jgi:O-antigen/teichoic acid export membrane protein